MQKWSGQSKTSAWGFRIFLFIIQSFPLSFSYGLLRFVAIWYLLFDKKANFALSDYFQTIGFRSTFRFRYRIYLNFGQALIDKLAVYVRKENLFNIEHNNDHYLFEMAKAGKGGILLGSHIGNWEIAGHMLKRIGAPIYVVLLENEKEAIKKVLEDAQSSKSFKTIGLSEDFSFIVTIREILISGGIVCMHADRFLSGMRILEHNFLDRKANFPQGPFILAAKLKVPVSFVYALKSSNKNYKFSCTKPILNDDPIYIAKEYILHMEEKVKEAPFQWYNFFPFWS